MNCQDFNNIIADLADYKPMASAVRDASVSHAALCPDCAANLAAARTMSSYLLQAARAESEEAPATVKTSLLAAFAVESQKSKVESQRQATLADFRPSTFDLRRKAWFASAGAIAAAVLLAVIIPILRNSVAPVSPPTKELEAKSSSSPAPSSINDTGINVTLSKENDVKSPAPVPVRTVPHKTRLARPRRVVIEHDRYESVARNNNEYLPLTYLTAGTAIESGTIVRVELSRAALASLGFTTGVDNSSESVKAEVVLGDDGVARAIRLVDSQIDDNEKCQMIDDKLICVICR